MISTIRTIADTLEARADACDPLSIAEMQAIAATLRSASVRQEAMALRVVDNPQPVVKIIPIGNGIVRRMTS